MTCKSSGVMKTLVWVFGVFFAVTEMAGHFLRYGNLIYISGTGIVLQSNFNESLVSSRLVSSLFIRCLPSWCC